MNDNITAITPRTRPWAAPRKPWLLRMVWHDLLFAHWPCAPEALQPLLPTGLALDTFDGRAWLGVVPFRMSGIRPHCLPPIPGLTAFPELNVRTYVVAEEKPGVWFLTLDAPSRVAVRCARTFYHLPYCDARITCSALADGWIHYQSRRHDRQHSPAEFCARYRPTGDAEAIAADPLANWLTARYCLYSADRRGGLWRGEIDHAPWPLEAAEATLVTNTMTKGLGLEVASVEPLLHFSRRLEARAWPLDRVSGF
jgi:uncharacterized protein YqjF (DUF2071 family)